MSAAQRLRTIILVSTEGAPLAVPETNRDTFPAIATWERDRVFTLDFQGNLGELPGFPVASMAPSTSKPTHGGSTRSRSINCGHLALAAAA